MGEDDRGEEREEAAQDISAAATSSLAEAIALREIEREGAGDRRRRGKGSPAGATGPGEAQKFLAKQSRMLDIQMEHLHEQRSVLLSQMRLRRTNEALRVAFQALTILAGLAVAAVLAIMAIQAHNADALIIEPFRTTPELAQRGMDGTVLASRLLDKLREIQNGTDSARAASTFTKDFGDDIKLEIPQTGVSIGELQRYLRQWLGHDTRISGEVFRSWGPPAPDGSKAPAGADRLFLTVRAGNDPGETVQGSQNELDAMIGQAAEGLVRHTQPYRYTVFLMHRGRYDEAGEILARLARSGPVRERAWAYVNWGVVSLVRDGDLAEAERKERAALRLNPDLAMAHDNLSGQEVALGHDESAMNHLKAEYAALRSHRGGELAEAVQPVLLAWSKTRLAEALGDYLQGARDAHAFQLLADYQGISSAALLNEAAALALAHDVAGARRLLAGADAAPGQAAFQQSFEWGSNLLPEVAEDYVLDDWPAMTRRLSALGAAPGFTLGPTALRTYVAPWLAYATAKSGNPAAGEALIAAAPADCYLCLRIRGKLAADRGEWAAARAWFDLATRQAPSLPFAWADWGEMLSAKGDPRGAASMFERAHRNGPGYAEPLERWGELMIGAGDLHGAVRKFEAASALAPRWGRLNLKWGDALDRLGRRGAATAKWREALTMDLSPADRATLTARLNPSG